MILDLPGGSKVAFLQEGVVELGECECATFREDVRRLAPERSVACQDCTQGKLYGVNCPGCDGSGELKPTEQQRQSMTLSSFVVCRTCLPYSGCKRCGGLRVLPGHTHMRGGKPRFCDECVSNTGYLPVKPDVEITLLPKLLGSSKYQSWPWWAAQKRRVVDARVLLAFPFLGEGPTPLAALEAARDSSR